ncbi:DUF6268 family outer membrane beta-barrel protein [Flavilitoribacter nigricans]|uniref:DUF6268 domain-containing protein n=1 Tax=Flavilitoribacter nigricans (strain ATCC 23147 / DSM 23189 / NBRC 102662 / NCIMB 1420 / SS-2) TaxID=1122177 RepID=A0A2D0N7N3_FLAN2|nr:DUF6268 family outer membrane beta-barrel protein [Flavilitoribacter nigricans]PHN04406.1 hypothetical protein CRP01_20570 [Flavilitoribacter nigricans DSM 23189 = NBRC 102662]
MIRYAFVLCLLLALVPLSGQNRPGFLGEDNDEDSGFNIRCLCRPGVQNKSRSRGLEISYQWNRGGAINPENQVFQGAPSIVDNLENLIFKLKVPIVNTEGLKVLAGFNYRPEQYYFDRIGPDYEPVFQYINERILKNTGFELFGSQSFNEKNYFVLRLKASYNGDYNGLVNFDGRYAIYNATGVFGIKKSENLEYGFGLNFTSSFRNTTILPFFIYNRNFNDRWGFESVLPALAVLRYNASPKTIFLGGFRYNSRSYSISVPQMEENLDYSMNHSEIRAFISAEQNLVPWIWLDMEVGYQVNFSTDFEAKSDLATDFMVELSNAPYLKLGIFISPPDSYLK